MLTVAAFKVPVKARSPAVKLIDPMSVPTAPLMLTSFVVLITKVEDVPEAVPLIAFKSIAVALPFPRVNVTPSDKTTELNVMSPVPEIKVLFPVTLKLPRFKAVFVVVMFPLTLTSEGLEPPPIDTPPVNVKASPPFPKVKVPVFEKVTALVIVLVPPVIDKL